MVHDICIKGDSLALTLNNKGIREINITCSLLFRNRTTALEIVDEELFSWHDCLHRFDMYLHSQVEPSNDAIRKALLTH